MFPKDEYAELPPQADENDEKMNKRTKEFNKLIIAREKMWWKFVNLAPIRFSFPFI